MRLGLEQIEASGRVNPQCHCWLWIDSAPSFSSMQAPGFSPARP